MWGTDYKSIESAETNVDEGAKVNGTTKADLNRSSES